MAIGPPPWAVAPQCNRVGRVMGYRFSPGGFLLDEPRNSALGGERTSAIIRTS